MMQPSRKRVQFMSLLRPLLLIAIAAMITYHTFCSCSSKPESVLKDHDRDILDTPSAEQTDEATVHIAVCITGETYLAYAITVIKSIVLFTDHRLQYYVVSEDRSGIALEKEIKTWPSAFKNRISVLPIELNCTELFTSSLFRTQQNNGRRTKTCVFVTLVNSDVIKVHTEKVIFLDVDVFAFDNIASVWKVFSEFDERHIMATAAGSRYLKLKQYQHKEEHIMRGKRGINSGIVLIHLENLRKQSSFSYDLIISSKLKYSGLNPVNSQDLLVLYFTIHPQQHYPLSCDLHFQRGVERCHGSHNRFNCSEAETTGIVMYHALTDDKFTTGPFIDIMTCFEKLDLSQLMTARQCFNSGIQQIKKKQCPKGGELLRNLETAVAKI